MKKYIFLLLTGLVPGAGSNVYSQWQILNFPSNMALDRGSFPTAQVGFVANSNNNKLWRTIDGGATWDSITFANSVRDVDFISADTGFVVHGTPSTYKLSITVNGGNTWSDVNIPVPAFNYCNMVYFTSYTNGVVTISEDSVLITSNTGATWTKAGLGAYGMMAEKEHINNDTLIFTGSDGTFAYRGAIFRSDDGGNNWQTIIHDSSYTVFTGTHFLNGSLGFAVYNNGWNPGISTLIKTDDGGTTWSDFYTDTTVIFQDVFMNSVNGGYIMGTNTNGTNGIILKTNNGSTWTTDFTTPYPAVRFIKGGNALYGIGNGGLVIKNSNPNGIEEYKTEEGFLYPNPSDGLYQTGFTETTSVAIYNVSGKLLKTVVLPAGEKLDVRELKNGMYIARFTSNNINAKSRLVIAR
ncbi:MAG: YCF48-related protein [Bacteroidota bacterium]